MTVKLVSLILFSFCLNVWAQSPFGGNGMGTYYGDTSYAVHETVRPAPQLIHIQGVGPNNLHPMVVKNPGTDGYYTVYGMPAASHRQTTIYRNQNGGYQGGDPQFNQLMKMQMMQNMQMQQMMMQRNFDAGPAHSQGKVATAQQFNQHQKKHRKSIGSNLFTKGKVNTVLMGAAAWNEIGNKGARSQKKVRAGLGGAYLINNFLR